MSERLDRAQGPVWLLRTPEGTWRVDPEQGTLTKPDGTLRGYVVATSPTSDPARPFKAGVEYRFEGHGEWDYVTPTRVETVEEHAAIRAEAAEFLDRTNPRGTRSEPMLVWAMEQVRAKRKARDDA